MEELKMENVKYAEFTGKVVEIDKKLDAAMKDAHNTIREAVKGMPRGEITEWAEKARDDDRVSPQIYTLVLMIARAEIHNRVVNIMDAIDKL